MEILPTASTAMIAVTLACMSVPAVFAHAGNIGSLEETARAAGDTLIPSCNFPRGLCGYLDRDGGVAVPPAFDWTDRFFDGRARITRKGFFGFIDEAGKIVVEPRFERAAAFYKDHAEVMIDDKAGLIDRQGKFAVRPKYAAVLALSPTLFWVDDGKPESQRPRNWRELLASPRDLPGPYEAVGSWGLMKLDGTWQEPPRFSLLTLFAGTDDGAFRAEVRNSPGQFYPPGPSGLIASDGSWLLPPGAEIADHYLYEGRARFKRDGKWGFIDAHGQIIVPLKFDDVRQFYKGYAGVKLGDKWGIIDVNGNWLFKPFPCARIINVVGDFAEVLIGEEHAWIDREGVLAEGPKAITPETVCANGISLRTYLGKKQFLDSTGRVIGNRSFDAGALECGLPSPVGMLKDDRRTYRWGLVDEAGAMLIEPEFQGIHGVFTSDPRSFVIALRGETFGFLYRSRTFVPKLRYKYMVWIDSDRFSVTTADNRRFDINSREEEIEPLNQYAPVVAVICRDGLTPVKRGSGRWGYADRSGQLVIADKYEAASCFRRGIAWAAEPDRRRWCAIDKAGEPIAGLQCTVGPSSRVIYEFPHFPGNDDYEKGLSQFWNEMRFEPNG